MQRKNVFRLALSALAATFLAAVAFGGMAITAYAAQDALPGDALFSVKTRMEQTRVALTRGAIDRAKLNLQFADRRLEEMLQLAQQGRYQDLDAAVVEFKTSTARAIDALDTISNGNNPAQAQDMTALVAGDLTRQSQAMKQLLPSLPDTAKPAMQDALATVSSTRQSLSGSQGSSSSGLQYHGTVEKITGTAWVIDGVTYTVDAMTRIEGTIQVGDPVEFYAFTAADGTQALWKVELASSPDGPGDAMESGDQEGDMEDASTAENGSKGTVGAISAGSWTIDGITYLVDGNTKIEGTIQVGDSVEFHSYTTADGTQALASVELKSQDEQSGESMDDMLDSTHEDGNQSGSTYDDENEDNSQPGNTTSNYDSQDDNHEDAPSGQSYEDNHEDDHNQSGWSGNHSSGDHEGDHEGHDD